MRKLESLRYIVDTNCLICFLRKKGFLRYRAQAGKLTLQKARFRQIALHTL